MDDSISRQAMLDGIDKLIKIHFDRTVVLYKARKVAEDLPSAQPERKTGRWIPDGSELGIKCNKCGKSFSDYVNAGTGYMFLEETPNFCPNCGADMRGNKDATN